MNLSNESIKPFSFNSDKRIEVADIFRNHSHKLTNISALQKKVIHAIVNCRTSALGGHALKCNECGHKEISYNSCRNRHCPKCQSLSGAKWVESRKADLLPVQYFHVVFTFSDILYPLALINKKTVYNILFRAVSETLKECAANRKNLGADIGFISVLHTWEQKLNQHPHVHCIVPGGGLSPDKKKWINSPDDFFIHVKILSTVFRAKFLDYLEKAFHSKELEFSGKISHLSDYSSFKNLLKSSCKKRWVVYAKKPFAGPEQVLNYLGMYTHRIAISNYRILALDESNVTFKWKDRRDNNADKVMKLDVVLFMKRFLLHILPEKFVRIRHYGLLGNRCKKLFIALCRKFLNVLYDFQYETPLPNSWHELMLLFTGKDPTVCPACGRGRMIVYTKILPVGMTFNSAVY